LLLNVQIELSKTDET